MATQEDVIKAIRNADAAGDSASVRQLGAVLQQMQAITQKQARIDKLKKDNPAEYDPESPEFQARYGPTSNMSTTDKVLAGAGKAFSDTNRGMGQLLRKVMPDKAADFIGLPTQADIDESKRLDAPLMKTTAGKVGNVGGSVAIALPTVFIPGVNTVTGSAAVGAGMGFTQPVASGESRLKNTVVGGALGAAAPVVARTVAAGYNGAKALVEPFTAKGRDAIAGRTLKRFGVEAGDLANTTNNPTVTGARTTLAEQITRPEGAAGAARLQDSVRSLDPEIAAKMAAREVENNAARVGTLREMAGEGGQREFYEAARSQAAKKLYGQAFSAKPTAVAVEGVSDASALGKSQLTQLAADVVQNSTGPKKAVDMVRAALMNKAPGKLVTYDAAGNVNGALSYEVNQANKTVFVHELGSLEQGQGSRLVDALTSQIPKDYSISLIPANKSASFWSKQGFSAGDSPGMLYRSGAQSTSFQNSIEKLMQMPAIKAAVKDAQELALNQGKKLDPAGSLEGLHNMKLVLDDQIANLSNGTVSQVNKARSIQAARDKLVQFMERVSPGYGEARATYAAMSKPLNQMDVADTLFRKGTSATSDLGGTPRLMPNRFVNLLKNEEATVKAATGRDLGKLSQVMEPEQFQKIMAVGQELDKAAAVGRVANGPGSATAQRLASQNVLRQLLGPTGLPQSWAESTLLNTVMRPVQFAYGGVAEPKIQAVLADLLLNPAKAQAVLHAARTAPQRLSPELRAALPYLEQALKTSAPAAGLSGQR